MRSSRTFFSASAVSNFWRRILGIEDVLDTDADAGRLVGVGGADAAARRPDLEPAEPPFARRVDRHVPGHDQVCVSGDANGRRRDAAPLELVELRHQEPWVDDAAGADDAELSGKDPGGNVVKRERLAAADDRVAGVRATLVAADDVRVKGEQVDDLPLPLVAPLGSHDHGRRHAVSLELEAD